MKGQAKPSWTPGRHAWLRVLADGARRKPKGTGEGSVATYCKALGWAVVKPPLGYYLTPEGEATLARWDAGDFGLEPKPRRRGFTITGLTPAQVATRLLDAGEGPAMAVYEALHAALFGEMPAPRSARRFMPGGVSTGPVLREGEVAAVLSPAHQRPCPIKVEAPAPVMREDAPPECTAAPPSTCELGKIQQPAPFGMAPHLGVRVTPPGFTACLACGGKGKGRYSWPCQPCNGSGRIRRTVEP